MAAVPKYKKLFKLFKTDIQPGISADDQVRFEYIQNTCIQSTCICLSSTSEVHVLVRCLIRITALNSEKTVQELTNANENWIFF